MPDEAVTIQAPPNPAAFEPPQLPPSTDLLRTIREKAFKIDNSKVPEGDATNRSYDLNDPLYKALEKSSPEEATLMSSTPKREDYPDNVKSEESKTSWQKLKAERDEFRTKAQQLEDTKRAEIESLTKQINEIKAQFDPDEFKATKEKNSYMSDEIRKLKVERHPDFIAKYDKPVVDSIEKAKVFLPQDRHSMLEKIFRLPDSPERDSDIENLIGGLPAYRQSQFMTLYNEATTAVSGRAKAIADNDQWLSQQEAVNKQNHERQIAEVRTRAEKTFTEQISGLNNPLFTLKDGDDAHNREVNRRIQKGKSLLLENNTPEDLAKAAAYAVAYEESLPLMRQAMEELDKLTKAADKQASRSMGKTTTEPASEKPASYKDAIARLFQGAIVQ